MISLDFLLGSLTFGSALQLGSSKIFDLDSLDIASFRIAEFSRYRPPLDFRILENFAWILSILIPFGFLDSLDIGSL